MPELKLEHSLVDNRYEVRERLNRGSYAEIFVAFDRRLGRDVVIKALNTSLQGTPDVELERTLIENFQNEAVALDSVRHPNIILRWGHGTAADLVGVPFHYLVLEYMPGGDLLKLCRSRAGSSLPISQALFYFQQVCEALAYAHSRGIIHRDLKPNNFLLSEDRKIVKIADFGVAKLDANEHTEITRVGADVYAPPEHHPEEISESVDRLTASADIYSLAKSFYTVVCGRAPNQFKADPILSLPAEAQQQPWAARLLPVLRRATDDEPAKRYSTVPAFWNDLMRVIPEEEVVAEEEAADETTIVKPRFDATPGPLPSKPLEPDFDATLASVRSHTTYTSATPVRLRDADRAPAPARSGRIVVQLHEPAPQPAMPPQPQPLAPRKPAPQPAPKRPAAPPTVAQRFPADLRRRVFLGLMALAVFSIAISAFNFIRGGSMAFGFGPPTEIEIVTQALNVRAGPSMQDRVLGEVEQASRHRVLSERDDRWMQIEVTRWSKAAPDTQTNVGWVYGNQKNIRVVSRHWW